MSEKDHPVWRHVVGFLAELVFFAWAYATCRRVLGADSPWLALLPMFFALALLRAAQPLVRLRLPPVLRQLRAWELSGPAYRRLGVLAFGRALRDTPLRHLNPNVYLAGGASAGDPTALTCAAEAGEAAHWIGAVVLMPGLVQALLAGWWGALLVLLVVQGAVNVYPILHLRHVRARLARMGRRR